VVATWDNNSPQIISEITCSNSSSNNSQLWVDLETFNNHSKIKINLVVSNKLHHSHHLEGFNLNNKPSLSNSLVVSISNKTQIRSETFRVLQILRAAKIKMFLQTD